MHPSYLRGEDMHRSFVYGVGAVASPRTLFMRIYRFLFLNLFLLLSLLRLNGSYILNASNEAFSGTLSHCLSDTLIETSSFQRRSKLAHRGDKKLIESKSLITGAGYSGTGFISRVFRDVGVDIGHETFGVNGSSNWLASSPQFPSDAFNFTHTFLLVRHPLRVLRSCRGTKWNFDTGFNSEMARVDIRSDFEVNISVFDTLRHDVQCLEWWTTYTTLGRKMAECWFRTEDANDSKLFESLCERSDFIGCAEMDFKGAIKYRKNYNAHSEKSAPQVSWTELEVAATHEEKKVIKRGRELCLSFFVNC